ncbi:MAG: amidohydrolase family protein [Amphiplicatus sp.]
MTPRFFRGFGALLLWLVGLAFAPGAQAQVVAIQNARVYTMGPAGVIDNGDVVMRDGLIAAVGVDLPAPEGATVIDAAGRIVTPGIFAPYSQLGLVEIDEESETNDSAVGDDFALSAAVDATDAYNPTSSLVAINRAGGVTRALSAPAPGTKLFGGRAMVVDLSGRIASVTKAGAAQTVALGAAGAERAGNSRLGAWASLREYLDEALSYAANPRDYVLRSRDPRLAIRDLEALGPVIAGRQPLLAAVNSAADIRTLIKIKQRYRLNVIVLGGAEAWRAAPELAAANVPVILDPLQNLPTEFEDLGATLANAARLYAAGARIAFLAPATHNLRLLPQSAGNAVAAGLPYEAALAALTINPATMFGLAGELGSLDAGKRADVVIWDGDPLDVTSRPVAVFIDGRAMSLENRQTKLRDRYRDLGRADLPFAYRGGE